MPRPPWTPNTPTELGAQVEHIVYEACWLRKGHDACREFTSPGKRVGSFAASDIGNLGLEAALVHTRGLLDFMFPRPTRRPGDVFACEYMPTWSGPDPTQITSDADAEQALGDSVKALRDALDGWLAHLGRTRRAAQPKPDWDQAFTGCRQLFVDWYDGLDATWAPRFREARGFAES